jgi:hypothetical protein
MMRDQFFERLDLDQRYVTREHQQKRIRVLKLRECLGHGITSAALLRLQHARSKLADFCDRRFLDFLRLMSNHYKNPRRLLRCRRAHDVRNKRPAAELVQHLRAV